MKKFLCTLLITISASVSTLADTDLLTGSWKFNDPARVCRRQDGAFRLNSPDDRQFAEMRQRVVLDQKEIIPLSFGASFRTVSGNSYFRREATYAAYLNLTLDNGKVVNCVMIGPEPGRKTWENLHRIYTPERPVKFVDFVICMRKRAGEVEVANPFLFQVKPASNSGIKRIGIGINSAELRHAVAGKDRNNRPFVLAAPLDGSLQHYLLFTELDTGKTTQYFVPSQGTCFCSGVLTLKGKYVARVGTRIVIFDVNTRELKLCGPTINGFCWSAALADDGTVYLGNIPSTLYAVNPETAEVKLCGRMDPVETQLFWIACDKNNWVYCGNGVARAGVIAYNPQTGEKRELVPEKYRTLGAAYVSRRTDGMVYISTPSGFSALCLDGYIMQSPAAKGQEVPGQHLKYGSKHFLIDRDRRILNYDINNKVITWYDRGKLKSVSFDYRSAGASLTTLAKAPDGKLYFSSAHPNHLGMVDPATDKITDFGYNPAVGGGNFCNMTSFNGKLYACEYAFGRMWEFDPAKPVKYITNAFFGIPMGKLIENRPMDENWEFGLPLHNVLLCKAGKNAPPLIFDLPVTKSGKQYLNLRFYHFPTYGIVTVKAGGQSRTLDLCGPDRLGDNVSLGPFDLKAGSSFPVSLSVVRHPKGKYTWFGLTGIELSAEPRTTGPETGNPRVLGQWAKAIRRPRTIQVHPNGREVLMAGFSYDGMSGGQFGIHDLVTGKNRTIEKWLPGESCVSSFFEADGNLIGGTTVETHGGHKTDIPASVFRLDWKTGKVINVFRCPGAKKIRDVIMFGGKILAAANDCTLYVIDPVTFKEVCRHKIGVPVRRAFQLTSDGRLFLLHRSGISQIASVTFHPTLKAVPPQPPSEGGDIADNRIYFICSSREIFSWEIPPAGKSAAQSAAKKKEVPAIELTAAEKKMLKKSAAQYRKSIIDPEVPRAFLVHSSGCPVCKDKIYRHGMYSWIIDPEKPFKIQCPECKNIFPDNDFAAFLATGDRSKLTGKYVDSGRGWQKPGTKGKYWFVGYYHHWAFYKYNMVYPLAAAYKRTGNIGFARRAAALLDRYAELYTRYNYNTQSRYAEEIQSTYNGRILNAIWETSVSDRFIRAYAIIKPYLLNQQDDRELSAVTGKKMPEIIRNIENNLFRVMANDIMSENGKNWGNFGMHQAALLKIAAVLKDPAMVKWVTDFRISKNWMFSIPLDYAIFNNVHGDGSPPESPQYNTYFLDKMEIVCNELLKNGIDEKKIFPGVERIFTHREKLLLCGKFMPASGDSGSLHAPVYTYRKNPADPLQGFRSSLLPSYGTASLQNERPEKPAAVWLSFGGYPNHYHFDKLNLEFFAENIPLSPDMGYPDTCSADDSSRHAFYTNTVAHNTVVVNARKQRFASPGVLLHYDPGKFAQRIEAQAPEIHPGLTDYRRTVIVTEAVPGKLIVLDIFRINGGKQHDWFFHGQGENASSTMKFVPREGTLAGENVAYGDFYDYPEFNNTNDRLRYQGSGYQYLKNIRYAAGKAGNSVTLHGMTGNKFSPEPGAYLKFFPLGNQDEQWFLADGIPPKTQKNTQEHLAFFCRRRTGNAPLKSIFASVIETGSDNTVAIDKVTVLRCDYEGVSVKVTLKNGTELTIEDRNKPENGWQSRAVSRDNNGKTLAEWKFSGKTLKAKITAVDLAAETITFDREIPPELSGSAFRVGRFTAVAGKINKNQVQLKDQTMIRARIRMVNGKAEPLPLMAKPGMAVFAADRKTFLERYPVKNPGAYNDKEDLWISEYGPGDEAVFHYPSSRK